jgi:hypothetical protein
MSSWSREKERRAIRWHLRRCRFCRALRSHSLRRGDVHLLDAADALVDEHAGNDLEHEAFGRRDERRSEAGRVTLPRATTLGRVIR